MKALQFCQYSNTIRQWPETYCLAVFNEEKKCWIMEPDLAADKDLVISLTLSLMEYANKYSPNGLHAILGMTPYPTK